MKTAAEILNDWYMSLPEHAHRVSIPDRTRLQRDIEGLIAQERERCAKIVEDHEKAVPEFFGDEVLRRIRGDGEQGTSPAA